MQFFCIIRFPYNNLITSTVLEVCITSVYRYQFFLASVNAMSSGLHKNMKESRQRGIQHSSFYLLCRISSSNMISLKLMYYTSSSGFRTRMVPLLPSYCVCVQCGNLFQMVCAVKNRSLSVKMVVNSKVILFP